MSKTIKHIALFPFSVLYSMVTGVRNFLFDKKISTSTSFNIPIICIGNLTVGGTGKTPHTEYIISLLQNDRKLAVLSRGYKRKTKGFHIAYKCSNSTIIGDESFQIYQKFPDTIVAVDEKRVHGVQQLLHRFPDLDAVILDDAFQHRQIQAGLSILLTDYNRLYTRDFLLPSGRLRESKKGNRRADIIIVTKCPQHITKQEIKAIEVEINPQKNQTLFFSRYVYSDLTRVFPHAMPKSETKLSKKTAILLMAGIVSPKPIVDYLKQHTTHIDTLFFPDHHNFTTNDFARLAEKFARMNLDEKIIVVTEKDAARLVCSSEYPEKLKARTYALPIQVKILDNKEILFTEKIKDYVKQNSRNG